MQVSEEWKSLFPISSVNSPPLLLPKTSSLSVGPLFFNPIPETLKLLISSPSYLSPPFLPPPPHLSLSRFLDTSTSHDSPILPTNASAIAASFDYHNHQSTSGVALYNRLEPLRCPNDWVCVFFPTGSNLDRVGFLVLSARDSSLAVVRFGPNDSVLTSPMKFDHQIIILAACSLADSSFADSGDVDSSGSVGFLLACTRYAAHWFTVKISGRGSDSEKPALVHVGSKLFTSCAVAYACWNPHLPGECVVLLESGALFLFDMESSCINSKFRGKRMSVAWDEAEGSVGNGWFCCEFSWHPRILVVANSKAVFLVDFRFGTCQPCCLLKVEMLGMHEMLEKDQFVAFSKAGADGFLFALASKHWLLLCDVRKPLMPVLRWAHNLYEPHHMTVLPLSELRSHPLAEKYAGASKLGSVIILGSFWNNEFNVFCYGRPPPASKQSFSTKISNFSDSWYAWELPSELFLSGQSCGCGTCLLKEEFAKDDLPEWVEWQQKKELILGFFMINKDVSSSLPKPGEHGGFTLVRLMSSGKLETQQYCASWKMARTVAIGHEITPYSKDSLLCSMGDEEYKFARRFKYLKLEYLYGHLNDNLSKLLFSKFRNAPAVATSRKCSNERFVNIMSKKMKESFGCDPPISHLSVSDIFGDVNMPTSLYEIVGRIMWIGLPMSVLAVAFPDYDDVHRVLVDQKKVSLEFPVIPDHNQAPPFFLRNPSHRSNKWSNKVKHGNDFVGPVVPLPASLVLAEISRRGHSFTGEINEYSPEEAFTLQCKSVMCLAKEMGVANPSNEPDKEHAVSLKDDKEETWVGPLKPMPFFLYEPSAFRDELPSSDDGEDTKVSSGQGERFNTVVARLSENAGGLFDDLCPVDLNFDCDNQKFGDEELSAYKFLKKQFSQWQDGFIPYQNLCERLKRK